MSIKTKERLRTVTCFELSCREPRCDNGTRYTRYIIAETKEDAIEMLENSEEFEKTWGLLQNSPEIVSEESVEIKITNDEYESLNAGTTLWDSNPFDAYWIKLKIPNMKEFHFNFTKTETITRKECEGIITDTVEDAIEQLKSKYAEYDLTDIKDVTKTVEVS